MRAYEIIFEDDNGQREIFRSPDDRELEVIDDRINTECSDALTIYRQVSGVLYRGSKTDPDFFRDKSRQREPKDTPVYQHNFLLKAFEIVGFKANRGNSIFTSGSREQASDYGNVGVIIPVNGFNFTWSRTIQDLYSDYLADKALLGYVSNNPERIKIIQDRLSRLFNNILTILDICTHQLNQAEIPLARQFLGLISTAKSLKSYKADPLTIEIVEDDINHTESIIYRFKMFAQEIKNSYPETYDTLQSELINAPYILGDFKSTLVDYAYGIQQGKILKDPNLVKKLVLDDLKYTDKNFAEAVKSKNEVLIQGQYWSINVKNHGEFIAHLLGI